MHSRLTPEQLAAAEASFNANYPTTKPHWSFQLSTVLNKPVGEVVAKLGGLENFETFARLNPICVGYTQVGRDCVHLPATISLDEVRARELSSSPPGAGADATLGGGGKFYPRIKFTAKDRMIAFWGLISGIVQQRGTYVWDEEKRTALWEVASTDTPERETWTRKVVKFLDDGNGKTKVEEFVEGYSEEARILEGVTMRFTRNIHRNWMNKYSKAWKDDI